MSSDSVRHGILVRRPGAIDKQGESILGSRSSVRPRDGRQTILERATTSGRAAGIWGAFSSVSMADPIRPANGSEGHPQPTHVFLGAAKGAKPGFPGRPRIPSIEAQEALVTSALDQGEGRKLFESQGGREPGDLFGGGGLEFLPP